MYNILEIDSRCISHVYAFLLSSRPSSTTFSRVHERGNHERCNRETKNLHQTQIELSYEYVIRFMREKTLKKISKQASKNGDKSVGVEKKLQLFYHHRALLRDVEALKNL